MDDKEKNELLHGLLELCSPEKVILHGAKRGLSSGRLKTANLCIVVPDCDKSEVLRRLYLHMPLDVQININLYTHAEWQELSEDPDSYAAWIAEKGTVLYES